MLNGKWGDMDIDISTQSIRRVFFEPIQTALVFSTSTRNLDIFGKQSKLSNALCINLSVPSKKKTVSSFPLTKITCERFKEKLIK